MKRFNWLLKRFAVGMLVFVAVVAVLIYGTRAYLNSVGSRELATISARLDSSDPGWRLEAIEAARQQSAPPPEQNSAPVVLTVAELMEMDKDWQTWQRSEEWSARMLNPHRPSAKLQEQMRQHQQSTAAARQLARDIRRFPVGQHTLIFHDNPFLTLLPHAQKTRDVLTLLEYDALLAALDNDPDTGILSAHAALNVGRSLGNEPVLISQLVRMAGGRVSVAAASQVLAWGTPQRGLAELQAAYQTEADEPLVINGLRGERAVLHRFFEGLESGQLTVKDLDNLGYQKPGPANEIAFHLYKGLIPGDHAKTLEILTAYIAAAQLPHHEQPAAFDAVPIPPGPPDEIRYILTRLLLPASKKVAEAGLRNRAELLCASVAIACERFRQKTGRWPEKLAEIPHDILPEVPLDPYTGRPLLYHRFSDGIAVYSVGDGNPNFARRQMEQKNSIAGLGIGCRLWDPDKRGQPPLPESEPPEPKHP